MPGKVVRGRLNPASALADKYLPGNISSRQTSFDRLFLEKDAEDAPTMEELQGNKLGIFSLIVSPADGVLVTDPTDPAFTGYFQSSSGYIFQSRRMVIGGVEYGVLKWGCDQYGNLIANSITLNGLEVDATILLMSIGWILSQTATVGSETRNFRMGLDSDGVATPKGRIEYNEPSGFVGTVPNGDFSSNDMSDWDPTAGTWDASGGFGHGTSSAPTKPKTTSLNKMAVTAGDIIAFTMRGGAGCFGTYGSAVTFSVVTKLDVKFYTAADALISTVNVGSRIGSQAYPAPPELSSGGATLGWGAITRNILVPATATQFEFIAYIDSFSGDSAYLDVDDFSYTGVANETALSFEDGELVYELNGVRTSISGVSMPPIVKTADQTIISNIVPTAVDDLVIPLAADSKYWFELTVKVTTVAGGSTMDMQLDWLLPSGASIEWGAMSGTVNEMDVVAVGTTPDSVAIGAMPMGLGTSVTSIFRLGGFITTSSTAGDGQLRFRQNTSNANNLQIDAGSFIRAVPLLDAGGEVYPFYTDTMAQEAVGSLLTDSSTIDFIYTPGASITADVIDGSLDEGKLSFNIIDVLLTGLAAGTNAVIAATDSIKAALENLQAQITGFTNGENTIQVNDNAFSITDEADATKIANFAIGSQATGTTVVVTIPAFSGVMTTNAGIQTLTNKRITKRTIGVASSATPTPNVSNYDQYQLTALAANATVGAPTGTPTQGEWLIMRFKDDGTSRTLTWNAIFRGIGLTLPGNTVANKTMYVFAIYNATDIKWDVWKVAQE